MPHKDPAAQQAWSRAYYIRNRASILAKTKARALANPERLKAVKQREQAKNRSRYLASAKRQWNQMAYWERKFHNTMNKAKAKAAAIIDVDNIREYYRKVFSRSHETCTYCRGIFSIRAIVIDHKQPYALGGRHEVSNLVVACNLCNHSKRAKPYKEWVAQS
jgi:5-methylcytosine-specific restriction endonuclease McrA